MIIIYIYIYSTSKKMISIPKYTSITILLLILLIQSSTKSTKEISSFNILLPTSYHPIKGHARQLIITSGDCYNW